MRYLLHAVVCAAVGVTAAPTAAAVVVAAPAADATVVAAAFDAAPTAKDDEAVGPAANGATSIPPTAPTLRRFPIVPARDAGEDVATLPEPATWGLMFLGFGGLSFALRRRSRAEERIRFS